ncbi:hypothetical protein SAMN05421825_1214 [Epilithonimonas hungarica]|uniref:Uncharacterized protein n=1 Tax=Epilithonimonas hungarica TaxID=454006 RepID=A0A1G7IX85_9FLAO|nr:hypothetical protein [Epilithonimonas hungarica]SDF17225.1 hypothetical protein SAMN05421825_1214 [Epilithonimonas hungarica]
MIIMAIKSMAIDTIISFIFSRIILFERKCYSTSLNITSKKQGIYFSSYNIGNQIEIATVQIFTIICNSLYFVFDRLLSNRGHILMIYY